MEMRTKCESCNTKLQHDDLAYICSFECTFCEKCTEEMKNKCPNCNGKLVQRPKRIK